MSSDATTQKMIGTPPDPEDHRRRLQALLGDEFQLGELIGQGGFGSVYAAVDRTLARDVAIKVIRDDLIISSQILQRFQLEARAVARIRHPHVLPVYSVGSGNGIAWMIMPRIHGESLRSRLLRGPLPIAEAVRIAREIGSALEEAHRAGLVHRDVKPENILLDGPENRALLMDFGIAKACADADANLTGTGMLVGTPAYMSPEQAMASRDLDGRTDVYALGCVLYEMLVGRTPFGGPTMALIGLHISEPVDPIDSVDARIPFPLARAVDKALEKRREDRFANAGDFVAVLGSLSGQAEVVPMLVAPTAPLWNRPLGMLANQARHRVSRAARWARKRQRWQLLVGAAVLGMVAMIAIDPASPRQAIGIIASKMSPPLADPASDAAATRFEGVSEHTVAVFGLSDTAIVVVAQRVSTSWIEIFNGTSWSRIAGPPYRYTYAVVPSPDGIVLLPSRPGPVYRLTGGRLVQVDSLPFGAASGWTNGAVMVAGGSSGELAINEGSGWRRLPSGRHTSIVGIQGHRADRLIAIGGFADGPGKPDSLLLWDGFAWSSHDPRPAQERLWIYDDAAPMHDGSMIVVGRDEGSDTTALVLRRAPGSERFERVRIRWEGDRGPIQLVRATSEGALLAGRTGLGNYRLYELRGDTAFDVPAFHDRQVAGLGTIGGRPYLVTLDGNVWVKGHSTWTVVSTAPGPAEEAAAFGDLTFQRPWLPKWAIATSGFLNVRRVLPTLGTDSAWVLATDGRLAAVTCRFHGICRATRPTLPGVARVADIGRDDRGNLVAIGDNGLVVQRSGNGWREHRLPLASGERIVRLRVDSAGSIGVLTENQLVRIGPNGQLRTMALHSALGIPLDFAVARDGQLAVLGTNMALLHTLDSNIVSLAPYEIERHQPTGIVFLPDNRVLISLAHTDPLLDGSLLLYSRSGSRDMVQLGFDPTMIHLTDYGVHFAGSGWYSTYAGWNQLGVSQR